MMTTVNIIRVRKAVKKAVTKRARSGRLNRKKIERSKRRQVVEETTEKEEEESRGTADAKHAAERDTIRDVEKNILDIEEPEDVN